MMNKQTLYESTVEEIKNLPINHVTKIFTNAKGYNRARDRKNKKLFEYEEDIINDFDENKQNIFSSSQGDSSVK